MDADHRWQRAPDDNEAAKLKKKVQKAIDGYDKRQTQGDYFVRIKTKDGRRPGTGISNRPPDLFSLRTKTITERQISSKYPKQERLRKHRGRL